MFQVVITDQGTSAERAFVEAAIPGRKCATCRPRKKPEKHSEVSAYICLAYHLKAVADAKERHAKEARRLADEAHQHALKLFGQAEKAAKKV